MQYVKLTEEALKSAIRQDYFDEYKYTQLGNIDFVIAKSIVDRRGVTFFDDMDSNRLISILWAEAKRGTSHDIYESFVQLLLTIGKEQTFAKYHPPKYIGAFDAEKFAFIEYNKVQSVFYQADFNWTVTPSNHDTKEFKQLYALCKEQLEENSIMFHYGDQEKELRKFIHKNFNKDKGASAKIAVTKNNFTFVYQRWLKVVKPTIAIDWDKAKRANIITADFFLADLLSDNNMTIKDSLYVVLKNTNYEMAKGTDEMGASIIKTVLFNDEQKAHRAFWAIYARPPKKRYQDFIVGRRDLLVPPDIREREGSYFTPQIWVEKSQQYLTSTLGENWQDEYYIWDNCGGTGNLENGLSNKRNIWVSTLTPGDVNAMKDMVANGFGLFEDHIFQFDFLNDELKPVSEGGKLPDELYEIITNPEKRKKLLIYINPPYGEPTSAKTVAGTGQNKAGITNDSKIYKKYKTLLGDASKELFALFLIRIYKEIPGCMLGTFSKLKLLQSVSFSKFRDAFDARMIQMFAVPAWTFDNVTGKYPISFSIWDLSVGKGEDNFYMADVFDAKGGFMYSRKFYAIDRNTDTLNTWIKTYQRDDGTVIGLLDTAPPDFQNKKFVNISQNLGARNVRNPLRITETNLIPASVYLASRWCIEPTWVNDRDQFRAPNSQWMNDPDFQHDCLIFTLFHDQNRIMLTKGDNHWIPFTEDQVGCKKAFRSNFMTNFLKPLFANGSVLSDEAMAVYNAGLELWKYYHAQVKANPNAAYYDIRLHFQGSKNGVMNTKSSDAKYSELVANLRASIDVLAAKIATGVYEYGILVK